MTEDYCAKCEKMRTLHAGEDRPVDSFEEDPYSGRMIDISNDFGYWHNAMICHECQEDIYEENIRINIQVYKEINAIKKEQEWGEV